MIKHIGNVLTGLNAPILDDDLRPEPKPKKVPKKKNQFKYQYVQVRPLILERDSYTCQKCGSKDYLEVNHIIPKSKGGTNDTNNLITLCDLCHAEEHKDEPVYKIMMKRITDRMLNESNESSQEG